MEIKTSVLNIGDSVFVRIPSDMVKYFKLKKKPFPQEASIKDVDKKTTEIKFT